MQRVFCFTYLQSKFSNSFLKAETDLINWQKHVLVPPILLRYNLHLALYKLKLYSIMTWLNIYCDIYISFIFNLAV